MREGWEYKKLEEVCDFQGGSQPPKMEWSKEPQAGYVRMLQIRDFTQNATDYIEYVKESKSLKYCKEDDILIGRYGASVGKILTGLSGAYNVAIIKTIPREIVNKNYIKYYFLSPYFQHNLLTVSQHRAAQAGFSKEDISDFSFPLPPLSEQQRIVSELDLLSSIIEKKKAQLKEYDQLAQSIFYDMFGDPVTNEKGWEVKKLGEVCNVINGFAFPSSDFSIDGSIKVVKITNVGVNEFIRDDSSLPDKYDTMNNFKVHYKDIVIALTRTIISSGLKRALVPFDYDLALVNQRVAAISVNDSVVQTFIYNYLGTQYVKDFVLSHATALMQPNLSINDLKTMPIYFPPLPLQQSFASKIEAIERQKALIQQSIAEVQMLFDSRMDDWFA